MRTMLTDRGIGRAERKPNLKFSEELRSHQSSGNANKANRFVLAWKVESKLRAEIGNPFAVGNSRRTMLTDPVVVV